LAILKTYRKKHREGKPEAKKLFMQLDPMLYKLYGDTSGSPSKLEDSSP
jgi:hypothetical protein